MNDHFRVTEVLKGGIQTENMVVLSPGRSAGEARQVG